MRGLNIISRLFPRVCTSFARALSLRRIFMALLTMSDAYSIRFSAATMTPLSPTVPSDHHHVFLAASVVNLRSLSLSLSLSLCLLSLSCPFFCLLGRQVPNNVFQRNAKPMQTRCRELSRNLPIIPLVEPDRGQNRNVKFLQYFASAFFFLKL